MQGEPAMCENNRRIPWETQYCVINICYHNRGQVEENTQNSPVSPNLTKSIPNKKSARQDQSYQITCRDNMWHVVPSYSKRCLSHQALTYSWQYKTIFMADSQSISLTAKPPIYLCFQIIWQLWLPFNGQWLFSHFTFCFLLLFFVKSPHIFINPLREDSQGCDWIILNQTTFSCWNSLGTI